MALKAIKRKYNFSDGSLGEVGDSLCAFAERDLTEMTTYGYNQVAIDAIKAKVTAFKAFAPDEYYAGLLMIATAAKNEAVDAMSEVAEGIVRRAIIKWDTDHPEVKTFGWTGYITKKDSDKVVVARLVHKRGTERLADLAGQGLTAGILTDLTTKINAADVAITEKRNKVGERDLGVNERITLGNDLHDDLVKLADTGKHIWEDVNESKYNDYVIYGGGAAGEQVATGSVAQLTIQQPSVVVDAPDDQVTITIMTPGASLTAYCSDDPTDEPGPVSAIVNDGTPFTGPASDLGWDATNFRLLLKNTDPAMPVDYEVRVG